MWINARWAVVLGVLGVWLATGCGGRSGLFGPGGGGGADSATAPADGGSPDSGGVPVCSALTQASQTLLQFDDDVKAGLRLAFDGTAFVAIWHSQPAVISSLIGDLRLARVDRAGKSNTSEGVVLATDNGVTLPGLSAARGEVAVVHRPILSSGGPYLLVRRLDASGKTTRGTLIESDARHAAVTPHGDGHLLLLAERSGVPELVTVSAEGAVKRVYALVTAQIIDWVGLWPTPGGGYAASLYSSNKNGWFTLLDSAWKRTAMASMGHGALITSPALTPLPGGFAGTYQPSARKVELELYDEKGKDTLRTPLASAARATAEKEVTALAWTGKQLAAVYPGPAGGTYQARLVGADGKPAGAAVTIKNCVGSAGQMAAAWGKDRLAVATLVQGSGVVSAGICLTLLRCP